MIALALKEPALLDAAGSLTAESFSVPLLGKVFDQLISRHRQGLRVDLGVLSELTPEEMSHITGICQQQQGPVNERAFMDCIRTIQGQQQAKSINSDKDLLAFRNKLKERKGAKNDGKNS